MPFNTFFKIGAPAKSKNSLMDRWTDFSVESKKIKYSFQRTYRSRSIHQGIFGFGWCTDFEKSIERHGSFELLLKDCQEDRALLFKKVGKNYVSNLDSKDKIIFQNGHFQRQKGLIKQIFDTEGRLIELKYFQWPVEIFYGLDHKIRQIKINHDQMIDLKFTPRDGDSLTVTAPGKAAFVYQLKDKNLISVLSKDGTKTVYHYNSFHNLTKIERGTKTIERMSYDNKKDWLIETSSDSECQQTYSYNMDPKKPLLFKTTVQKFCQGELKSEIQWTYELKDNWGAGYRIVRSFSHTQNFPSRIAQKNGVSINDTEE